MAARMRFSFSVRCPREGAALSLVPSKASGEDDSVQFDAYGILSPSSLCLEYGLEQPCDLTLHR